VDRIRVGNEGWQLCNHRDCEGCSFVPCFDAWVQSAEWLRRFKRDFRSMSVLRDFCGQLGWRRTDSLEDEEVVEQIARGLRGRRLRICIEPIRGGARTAAVEPEPEETAQAAVKKASPKTWVEFEVVDMEDKPVSGYRFRVVLPDGSAQEGTLDKTGKVRFEKIDFDNSMFSLPDLDQEAWERVG
jgi:hypothetical protein